MIAATGLAALWLATGLAVLQLVLAFRAAGDRGMVRAVAIVQGALTAIALAMPLLAGDTVAVAEAGVQLGLAYLAVATAMGVSGKSGRQRAVRMRPWVLAGWVLLTLGITLGSYRARIPLQAVALAAWAVATGMLHLGWRRHRQRPVSFSYWGAALAHAGFVVALVGLVAAAALGVERSVILQPGEQVALGPWLVQLNSVTPTAGPGWTAIAGEVEASRGVGPVTLEPQLRYAIEGSLNPTGEPAIQTFRDGRLGAAIEAEGEGWQLRLWWKPFVTLIWLGGLLASVGGLLILAALGWRLRRRRPEVDWRRGAYE